jgi:hypothetical protein
LAENRVIAQSSREPIDVTSFAYERLADHLIAEILIAEHAGDNPTAAFQDASKLAWAVRDESACRRHQGLLEALCIQLPERTGRELPDCLDDSARKFQAVREAFLHGLPWREPSSFGDKSLNYINGVVLRFTDSRKHFISTLLTVAANPNHPYNSEFLHDSLAPSKMADRDSLWSILIHEDYRPASATDRLVRWAWQQGGRPGIGDDAAYLALLALVWLFTTSHRFLRDRATKAVVALLTPRVRLIPKLLAEFREIDDPYVTERLVGAAYGALCRNPEPKALATVAQDTYDWIFKAGRPPAHVLLRDYARNIIELALHRGVQLDIEERRIHPPYESNWPNMEIPGEEELAQKFQPTGAGTEAEQALHRIYWSAHGHGDFARYEVESACRYWTSQSQHQAREPSLRHVRESFEEGLNPSQKRQWERLQCLISAQNMSALSAQIRALSGEHSPLEGPSPERREERKGLVTALADSLHPTARRAFLDRILPFEEGAASGDEKSFDPSLLSRWILQRVLELGWTQDFFGAFDSAIRETGGREAYKAERMGKKYQWIALHEAIARISDNFHVRHGAFDYDRDDYEGPWQLFLRDIDPTCLLRGKQNTPDEGASLPAWFQVAFDQWELEKESRQWLERTEHLPSAKSLLEVRNPEDGSIFLNMHSFFRWRQPIPVGEELYARPTREVWFKVQGYVVAQADAEMLVGWAQKQRFYNEWMPYAGSETRVFLHEYYWSPAFRYHYAYAFQNEGWTDEARGAKGRLPAKLLLPAYDFLREHGTHDCSVDGSLGIEIPCKWLFEKMRLRTRNDGLFTDPTGRLVASDPSVLSPGNGCLLLRKDILREFLEQHRYTIFWTLLGEKNIYHSLGQRSGRLEMNGGYRLDGDRILGSFTPSFVPD